MIHKRVSFHNNLGKETRQMHMNVYESGEHLAKQNWPIMYKTLRLSIHCIVVVKPRSRE